MKRLLCLIFLLLTGGIAFAQVPPQAAAVGYNTLTYGPLLFVGTDPTVSPLPTTKNWEPFNFFGTSWTSYGVTTNGDGSINIPTNTINGFGAQISTAVVNSSAPNDMLGTAFGGGWYAEVTMSFAINPTTGGPAFWANDIESMAGGSAGNLVPRHWPGQVRNYGDWIETDIAEFDPGVPANQYGISMHNFFGPGSEFGGETFQVNDRTVNAGNLYTQTVSPTCVTSSNPNVPPTGTGTGIVDGTCRWNFVSVMPSNGQISTLGSGSKITFPGGTVLTQKHKYGELWVPATASTQGFAKYYFDGVQVGNTCTWNQYNSSLAPPPVDALSPTGCGNGSAYSVRDTRHMALILGNGNTVSAQNPGAVTVYSVNVWQASAANDLGPTNPPPANGVPPIGCTTLTCSGTALPLANLSVAGAQLQSAPGTNVRPACATYNGSGVLNDFTAIKTSGFNCVELGWRDAYLAGSGTGTTTFNDGFATAPWLAHEAWQSGDKWSFAGINFHTGTGQGPTWWANPIDTPAAASVYSDAGGALSLSLIKNPPGSGISPTGCITGVGSGQPCTTIGALINNQQTPGGLVQLFGYTEFNLAVPNVPGFLVQWDEECLPATCSDAGAEIDLGIWTDGGGTEHVQLMSQANGLGNVVWYATTSIDITKQNIYGINWQTDFITLYINGTQVAKVPTPSGEFQTAGMFSYFLTSDATYFGYSSAGPNLANLPATAVLRYVNVYQTKPTAPTSGCNSLAQIQACVVNATNSSLAVILNHLGNEVPTAGCVTRQQNGLWFDQGTDSGGDDGCGDGSNWSAAAFQQNTVNLLAAFNNNPTVVGYEFHNEPVVSGAFTGTGGSGGGTGFTANHGQIFDPNGVAWVGRGFSVTSEDVCGATAPPCNLTSSNVPLSLLQKLFPRVNYVRVANFLQGGASSAIGPQDISAWVKTLTDVGIRVEFSDYEGNSGGFPCNSNSGSWYQTNAKFYASNPFVTWEGQNECFAANGAVTDWQQMNIVYYNAVHRSPIWASGTNYIANYVVSNGTQGGTDGNNYQTTSACTSGSTKPSGTGSGISDGGCSWNYLTASATTTTAQYVFGGGDVVSTYHSNPTFLKPFSNVVFDMHPYVNLNLGYCPGCTQAQYTAALSGYISAFKSFSTDTETNIPAIQGEFGDNGSGASTPDADGIKAVTAVFQNLSTGGATTTGNGAGLWVWFCGQPAPSSCQAPAFGDQLTTGGPNATIYNDSENYGSISQGLLAAAPGSGPTPATGGGGGGGGGGTAACTAFPTANSCGLTQAQLNTLAANINSTMFSEVPGGECFGLAPNCASPTLLVGDTIVTTATNLVTTGNDPVSLTDSAGNAWTLQSGQSCAPNGPDWWWAGIAENGVPQWCGYSMAIRKLNSGEVWVEEAKGGGWWSLTQWQANGHNGRPGETGTDPGPGPNNFAAAGGGGTPPVNWSGGGPTDIRLACSNVGTAVYAVNPGVVEFCPGPINNTGTTLLNGTSKTFSGTASNNIMDLSLAQAHPVTGFPASKIAYSVHLLPTNVWGSAPDQPLATAVAAWNAYFGYLEKNGIAPVLNLSVGCACDNSQGNNTDDQTFMANYVAYANGVAPGGPTFTGTQQPMGTVWNFWGASTGNPNGTLNPDGTLKGTETGQAGGQAFWWSQLLQGAAIGPPPPPQTTTWNPSDLANITLSNNNLTATSTATTPQGVRSTTSKSNGGGLFCWAVIASTIQTNWVAGIANASWARVGATANSIDFVPANTQSGYTNNVRLTVGSTPSVSGEEIDFCANFNTDLLYASDLTMASVSGAGSWNNSNTCDPTVPSCGMSFAGMGGPFYIMFYDPTEGGAVAVLNTAGPFSNPTLSVLPSGYNTWDAAVVSGSKPLILIFGDNDNQPRAANDNRLALAERMRR